MSFSSAATVRRHFDTEYNDEYFDIMYFDVMLKFEE